MKQRKRQRYTSTEPDSSRWHDDIYVRIYSVWTRTGEHLNVEYKLFIVIYDIVND